MAQFSFPTHYCLFCFTSNPILAISSVTSYSITHSSQFNLIAFPYLQKLVPHRPHPLLHSFGIHWKTLCISNKQSGFA